MAADIIEHLKVSA